MTFPFLPTPSIGGGSAVCFPVNDATGGKFGRDTIGFNIKVLPVNFSGGTPNIEGICINDVGSATAFSDSVTMASAAALSAASLNADGGGNGCSVLICIIGDWRGINPDNDSVDTAGDGFSNTDDGCSRISSCSAASDSAAASVVASATAFSCVS